MNFQAYEDKLMRIAQAGTLDLTVDEILSQDNSTNLVDDYDVKTSDEAKERLKNSMAQKVTYRIRDDLEIYIIPDIPHDELLLIFKLAAGKRKLLISERIGEFLSMEDLSSQLKITMDIEDRDIYAICSSSENGALQFRNMRYYKVTEHKAEKILDLITSRGSKADEGGTQVIQAMFTSADFLPVIGKEMPKIAFVELHEKNGEKTYGGYTVYSWDEYKFALDKADALIGPVFISGLRNRFPRFPNQVFEK
jgi:hypothetical protein